MTARPLAAPFPYFGGKSRIASAVWKRLGDPTNYVEPFAGSLAVLLARPGGPGSIETVNDLDGFISNTWRALAADPEQVAHYADWPANECDLHARHLWLLARRDDLASRQMADPDYYDAKIAGWWIWGICCWIGREWCAGNGPWIAEDGQFVKRSSGQGVQRTLVHLANAGRGVHRNLGNHGLLDWFAALSERLRRVRVCSGDWARVVTPIVTTAQGLTGVLLDPPYSAEAHRDLNLYRLEDAAVAHAARSWALEHGGDPFLRIALCGYEGEYEMPPTWECLAWKSKGGYGSRGSTASENAARERVWFSPSCLQVTRPRQANFSGLLA